MRFRGPSIGSSTLRRRGTEDFVPALLRANRMQSLADRMMANDRSRNRWTAIHPSPADHDHTHGFVFPVPGLQVSVAGAHERSPRRSATGADPLEAPCSKL